MKTHIFLNGYTLNAIPSGALTYTNSLFKSFFELAPREWEFTIITPYPIEKKWEQSAKIVHLPIPVKISKLKNPWPILYWEQRMLPRFINQQKVDGRKLFFCPFQSGPVKKINSPKVMVCHDTFQWEDPPANKSKAFRYWRNKRAIQSADKVITISQYSKDQISQNLNVAKEKIVVAYEDINSAFRTTWDAGKIAQFHQKNKLPEKYLFYIGGFAPRKNLPGLINGYCELYKKYKLDIPLVMPRDKELGADAKEIIDNITNIAKAGGVSDKISFPVIDGLEDIIGFYQSAWAFISATWREGFGLPPLEAMASGCPVIISGTSSIPEICGQAAIYLDPGNPTTIAKAINELWIHPEKRNQLIDLGKERVNLFTWEKTVKKIFDAWENLLDNKKASVPDLHLPA